MKKLLALILIDISILCACQSSLDVTPTLTLASPNTAILAPTLTPFPTNISTPTLEPISGGWSTFHSLEYGFSFQYPAVYDQGFYDPTEPLRFCNIQTELKDSEFNIRLGGFVQIIVYETNKNLQDYVNEEIILYSTDGWQISSKQISVDNVPGIRLDLVDNNMSRWVARNYFVYGSYAIAMQHYEGSFLGCDPKGTNYSLYWVYEQIINTLKFDK